MARMTSRNKFVFSNKTRYIVSGIGYDTLKELHHAARSMGFEGGENTIRERYMRGINTWPELSAPLKRPAVNSAGLKARKQRDRDEMAEICRQLDERKK